jgi:Sulfotransferase family
VSSQLHQPIFVVGCPRSGTTLVQCILSATSWAFSLPETHFFSYVLPMLALRPESPISAEHVHRARDLLANELPDLDDVWTTLANQHVLCALDIFLAIVEHFRTGADLRPIEKTPLHVMHLEQIGACFPDALFVNVVRDPVDVTSSLLGVPWFESRSVLSHAQRWTEAVTAARAFERRHPQRLYTVVYEALVQRPEDQARALCGFLGFPFEQRMLEEFGREAARNVGSAETWKRDVGRGVLVDRAGVWRTRMTPGQAWLVAQATREVAQMYGYSDRPAASAPSVLSAMAREARVRWREARAYSSVFDAARHAASVLKTA